MKEDIHLSESLLSILQRNEKEQSLFVGQISLANREQGIQSILVTSANNFEGKTVTALSMAYAVSTLHNEKVLLIDGNLRYSAIHKLFNIAESPGFTDFVLNGGDSANFFYEIPDGKLAVMPAGTKVAKLNAVYDGTVFKARMEDLKSRFNYVIYDGHSVLNFADTTIIARFFDTIVLVAECEKTKYDVLTQAKSKLEHVGGNIWGVVLNKRKFYIPRILYGKI